MPILDCSQVNKIIIIIITFNSTLKNSNLLMLWYSYKSVYCHLLAYSLCLELNLFS
jgi:hypothetical protein